MYTFASFNIWLCFYYLLTISHVFDCFEFRSWFWLYWDFEQNIKSVVVYLTVWSSVMYMYLTMFLFFFKNYGEDQLNQSCIWLLWISDMYLFSSYSYVSIISHVFDCIENGSVMYLTIVLLYLSVLIDHDISNAFDCFQFFSW